MNILSIGTIDMRGGAAQVSWALRNGLKALGHTVNTFVRYRYSDEPDVFRIPRQRYQDWLVKIFANDLTFAGTSYIFETKEYKEADIVHCHNLHSNFFNLKDLIRMSAEKPVVWTLHDIWAVTGFAYNSATLRTPNKKKFLLCLWDNTPRLLAAKERIYAKSKLNIVAVSDWVKHEAEKGILAGQKISRVYNGIDTALFKPGNKSELRASLGLPLNKKIVGCGIKGWQESNKIIDSYSARNDVFFVAIGHDNIRTNNKNFRALPRSEERKTLAQYLGSLDFFLHPTDEEAFGLISAEAMACDVPIITYGVDAMPEIVAHGQTGYVARYKNAAELENNLSHALALSPAAYQEMSGKCRQRICDKFTLERMLNEYLELYDTILP